MADVRMSEMILDEEWNGRACSYFARWMNEPGHDPDATCSFGCEEEPECVTGAPSGGWPPLATHNEGASGWPTCG